MTTTKNMTDATTLRRMATTAGLNVRVLKGKGCRTGAIHFFMRIDSTREQREAAVAFLLEIGAAVSEGYGRTDLSARDPNFFNSITVHSFNA